MTGNGILPSVHEANPKPGVYPLADRANLFGTFLVQYHTAETVVKRLQGFHGMMSIVYPKGRHDAAFMELYAELVANKNLEEDGTQTNMLRLVMEACRIMDDIGTWDYAGLKRSAQE